MQEPISLGRLLYKSLFSKLNETFQPLIRLKLLLKILCGKDEKNYKNITI